MIRRLFQYTSMSFAWILLFLSAASPSLGAFECGVPHFRPYLWKSGRIVGGTDVRPHSHPWQIQLLKSETGGYSSLCGGSLVHFGEPSNGTRFVLTAAHCITTSNMYPRTSRFTVVTGAHNIKMHEKEKKRIPITSYYVQYWNPRMTTNDIALLRLAETVYYNEYTRPVCLPKPNEELIPGDICVVTGWGDTRENGTTSDTLKQVDVKIMKQGTCANVRSEVITFCAGAMEGGKDSCQGDSGGPLICKKNGKSVQYGVVSYGTGCARKGYPGVYAKVPSYVKWLNKAAKELENSPEGTVKFASKEDSPIDLSTTSRPYTGSRPTSPSSGSRPTYPSAGSRPTYPSAGSRPTSPSSGSRPTSPSSGSRPTYPSSGSRPTYPYTGSRPTPQKPVFPSYQKYPPAVQKYIDSLPSGTQGTIEYAVTQNGVTTTTYYHFSNMSRTDVEKLVNSHKVVVFMKGIPEQPLCGFSNLVVQILKMHEVPFQAYNVLEDESLRQGIKDYTDWQTIPQVFVNGKFIGGADILLEMHKNRQLEKVWQENGVKKESV
ncbi:Chymotrypsin-C [Trichinella murrelli]|uniref:Glutaredoxin-related protein 5, mitochondrial n=1 Tax=Trichinella murrelli TaxID=144512 RepID=A0A0V0U6L7_9BILA|nr:Chymotrypsin-C [Trichinella murrelli]